MPRRLPRERQVDGEPWPEVGIHRSVEREGRPLGHLRHDDKRAPSTGSRAPSSTRPAETPPLRASVTEGVRTTRGRHVQDDGSCDPARRLRHLLQPIGSDYWAGVPYSFAPGFRGDNRVSAGGRRETGVLLGRRLPGQGGAAWLEGPRPHAVGHGVDEPGGLQAGRMQQWNAGLRVRDRQGLRGGCRISGEQGHGPSTAAT